MIDIENEIYDYVVKAVQKEFPNIQTSGLIESYPSKFPALFLAEGDNSTNKGTADSATNENYVNVMYRLSVYSNKSATKKSECKAIVAVADKALICLGFQRLSLQPVPNQLDPTIYRMEGRYTAVVGKDRQIYKG